MQRIQNTTKQNALHPVAGIVGVVGGIILLFSWSLFSSVTSSSVVLPIESLHEVAASSGVEEVTKKPYRLLIPAIAVDASVQYVGLDRAGTGEMAVPDNMTDVGWYKYGTRPGEVGSAVVAGHLDGREASPAVFYDLHTLAIGDEVIVLDTDEVAQVFQVVRIETYPYRASTEEVFVSTDEKVRLNLITCSGEWVVEADRYDTRTVVFTELVRK